MTHYDSNEISRHAATTRGRTVNLQIDDHEKDEFRVRTID